MLFRAFLWLLFVGFIQEAQMRECLALAPEAIQVDLTAVAQRLGAPNGSCENGMFQESYAAAHGFLAATARPQCVVQTVDLAPFSELYDGEGKNDRDTPLEMIVERSQALALFAVTLGQKITDKVAELFAEHEYLTATLLDTMASLVTEGLVESLETRFARYVAEHGGRSTPPAVPARTSHQVSAAAADAQYPAALSHLGVLNVLSSTPPRPSDRRLHRAQHLDNLATKPGEKCALAYSPGYCGWHVSGQNALFSVLEPEQIGVSLGTGCMMRPLKSVSGVLVAGGPEIHDFDPAYTCCSGCDTLECRERIARITGPATAQREIEWTCSNE